MFITFLQQILDVKLLLAAIGSQKNNFIGWFKLKLITTYK